MPVYNVPTNNWLDLVKRVVNGANQLSYTISGVPNPAGTCPKNFTATYKCGNGPTKNVTVAAEANGKLAAFNCLTEAAACGPFKLTLGDDGNLVLTNGTSKIWESNTKGKVSTMPLEKYKQKNGKNGKNYLLEGDMLELGEFIGSPSGNCYLIMDKDKTGQAGLQLRYDVMSDCSKPVEVVDTATTHNGVPDKGDWMFMGCFNDSPNRALPNQRADNLTMDECIKKANDMGDVYAAKQFNYQCFTGTAAAQFDKYGPTTCGPNGDAYKNSVWKKKSAKSTAPVSTDPFLDKGCWNDNAARTLTGPPQQYGFDRNSCYQEAVKNGSSAFALQNGGWCVTSKPGDDYAKLGPAGYCPEAGGPWINHVFTVNKQPVVPPVIDGVKLFTIPKEDKTLYGKMGYVSEDGKLHEYPADMLGPSTDFQSMGKYNTVGHDLASSLVLTTEQCKEKCAANAECVGFVFGQDKLQPNKNCFLKKKGIFPEGLRVPDEKLELYLRGKGIKNHASCSKTYVDETPLTWANYELGDKMSMQTLCNLGAFTEAQQKAWQKEHEQLTELARDLKKSIRTLAKEDTDIADKLSDQVHKLTKETQIYAEIQDKKYKDVPGSLTVDGMKENAALMSESDLYRNIMWSIAAVFFVGVSVKILRDISKKSA
jgi:hypothetical protein